MVHLFSPEVLDINNQCAYATATCKIIFGVLIANWFLCQET